MSGFHTYKHRCGQPRPSLDSLFAPRPHSSASPSLGPSVAGSCGTWDYSVAGAVAPGPQGYVCLIEVSTVAKVTGAGCPSECWALLGRKRRSEKWQNQDPWMEASPSSWGAAAALCKALSHRISLRLPPARQPVPTAQKTRGRMIIVRVICGAPGRIRRQAKPAAVLSFCPVIPPLGGHSEIMLVFNEHTGVQKPSPAPLPGLCSCPCHAEERMCPGSSWPAPCPESEHRSGPQTQVSRPPMSSPSFWSQGIPCVTPLGGRGSR